MKFKKIPHEYFITILDRLTRFEPANIRYKRVFDDIISRFLIDTNLKKNLNIIDKIALVEQIIDNSLENNSNININDILFEIEDKYFIKNSESLSYLSSKIDYVAMYNVIKGEKNLPKNLNIFENILNNPKNFNSLTEYRTANSLLYPVSKILLCEGQTEFLLLKTIFSKFNCDFDKNGILVIEAGGKNQVAKKYYKMLEYCKIPFFILLDKDAIEIKDLIEPKLRKCDKMYLIKSGEFEDLIPAKILLKVVNFIHNNEFSCIYDDFIKNESMVKNLEEIYKKYGFGEFKKAHFAFELNEYLKSHFDCDDFKNSEISDIVNALQEL